MPGPLLVVDAPSLLFRAFHALPASITDDRGQPVNALLGTANLILREVEAHAPRAVVLCFGPFGWYVVADERFEADDVLGSLARIEDESGGEALILTGDRDMFQCVNDSVSVLYVRTGSQGAEVVDAAGVLRRYGVAPELVPDF